MMSARELTCAVPGHHSGITECGGPSLGLEFTQNSIGLQVVKHASSFVGEVNDVIREAIGDVRWRTMY
jgi:hypothetical protein